MQLTRWTYFFLLFLSLYACSTDGQRQPIPDKNSISKVDSIAETQRIDTTQFKIEIPNALNASSKKYIGIYLDSPEKQKQFIHAAGQNGELNNITFDPKKISECVLIYSNSLDLMDDCLRYKCTYIHAGQGDDIDMIFKKLQYQYLFLTKKTLNQESFV